MKICGKLGRYIGSLLCLPVTGCCGEVASPLHVELINRTSSQAFVQWSGVRLSLVEKCQFSHCINNKGNQSCEVIIIPDTQLSTTVYGVSDLTAANEYILFVECTDKNGEPHKSEGLPIPPGK